MILYRNTKVKVRSPDGDTDYFDIVAEVLQEDTLAPYLFIVCLDYILRTSIDNIRENGFELTKKRSRRYPAKTITDTDYADDIALLANTPNQAKTLLHSLERAAAGIGLHVNAHKTEFMCFNQKGDISTLDGTSLKLVDKFTYLGSSVSSTEKDFDTRLTKAWTAIDRLSVIWKSNLTNKMKRSFFQIDMQFSLFSWRVWWSQMYYFLTKEILGKWLLIVDWEVSKSDTNSQSTFAQIALYSFKVSWSRPDEFHGLCLSLNDILPERNFENLFRTLRSGMTLCP